MTYVIQSLASHRILTVMKARAERDGLPQSNECFLHERLN